MFLCQYGDFNGCMSIMYDDFFDVLWDLFAFFKSFYEYSETLFNKLGGFHK